MPTKELWEAYSNRTVCPSLFVSGAYLLYLYELYPRYEVNRGYIVFAFSVIMFVCLSVNFFFSSKISQQLLGLGF